MEVDVRDINGTLCDLEAGKCSASGTTNRAEAPHVRRLPMKYALLVVLALTACRKPPPAESASDSSATSTASTDCPKDLLAARGTPCAAEGKTCTAGPGEQTHFLMCSGGKWTEMDAPPPPPATTTAPPVTSTAPLASSPPRSWDLSCKKDADCVVVRAAGCCPSPCPAGVVNKRDQARVEADLAAACRKEPSRPCVSAGACRGHAVLCENGKCGVFYEGDPKFRSPRP